MDYYKTKLKETQNNILELKKMRKKREESNEETIYCIKKILDNKRYFNDENTELLMKMMEDVKKNQRDTDYQFEEYYKGLKKTTGMRLQPIKVENQILTKKNISLTQKHTYMEKELDNVDR